MPRNPPPNTYMDMPLGALGAALMERAGQLLGQDRVGRRDTAYALIAAAHAIGPQSSLPNSAARLAARSPSAGVAKLLEQLAQEQVSLRWWVVSQAADILLPLSTERDALSTYIGRQKARAIESDKVCQQVLLEMASDIERWRAVGVSLQESPKSPDGPTTRPASILGLGATQGTRSPDQDRPRP